VDDGLLRLLTDDPLRWFDLERPAISQIVRRAAHDGHASACWGLACTASPLFQMRRYFDDGQDILEVAHAAAERARDDRGTAAVLYRLGILLADRDEEHEARERLYESAAQFDRLGDRHGWALACLHAATIDRRHGNHESALRQFNLVLPILHSSGDRGAEAFALRSIGQIHLELGEHDEAQARLSQALDVSRRCGSRRGEAQVLYWQGRLALAGARYNEAEPLFAEVLVLARRIGDLPGELQARRGLGSCHQGRGDLQLAESAFSAALEIATGASPTLLERRIRADLEALAETRQRIGWHQ
jgi:tetratricopeptide (TPR) repeat protein